MNDAPELPPQPRDEYFDRVRIAVGVLRVDVFGQLALRDDAAAVVHQVRQHAKFVARQLHRRAVDGDLRRARGSSATGPQRSSGVTCPLARRISARRRASTSSIRNGFAT